MEWGNETKIPLKPHHVTPATMLDVLLVNENNRSIHIMGTSKN